VTHWGVPSPAVGPAVGWRPAGLADLVRHLGLGVVGSETVQPYPARLGLPRYFRNNVRNRVARVSVDVNLVSSWSRPPTQGAGRRTARPGPGGARQVFARAGLRASTIEEIAQRAGVTRQGGIRAVRDKNALFDAVIARVDGGADVLFGTPPRLADDVDDTTWVRAHFGQMLRYLDQHPDCGLLVQEAVRIGTRCSPRSGSGSRRSTWMRCNGGSSGAASARPLGGSPDHHGGGHDRGAQLDVLARRQPDNRHVGRVLTAFTVAG